jgi:replicative DNA helicase
MGESRGNVTQSVQNSTGPRKSSRNGKRTRNQSYSQDEHNISKLGRPGNIEAERNVLGSILLKPDVCDDVALSVRPEDFADEAHQIIFRHLLDLHDGGARIDATIIGPITNQRRT